MKIKVKLIRKFLILGLISNIKEDINIKIGISTKIIYLSVKIGCLNKLYARGKNRKNSINKVKRVFTRELKYRLSLNYN